MAAAGAGVGLAGVSFFGASQDIALDAFRREYLTDEELGFGTGVWMNAWRLGMYVSVGLAFLTADANVDWGTIHFMLAGMMLIGIITTLIVPEPDMPPGAPTSIQAAIVQPFGEFFRRTPKRY